MATAMHLPSPVSLHASSTTGELQDPHRSRSCQTAQTCPRPRPACLFQGNSGGGAAMFSHLLKKSSSAAPKREVPESTAAHCSPGNEDAAVRSAESAATTPTATTKPAPAALDKSPLFGSSVLLHRSNSSSQSHLFSSFEILSSDASPQQKMQAANALANLTLRCELLPRFQEPEFLDQLVGAMKSTEDECAKRFVYMALVRLIGHREMVQPCLQHSELLPTTVAAASLKAGSSWRQAARALAVIATKCRASDGFRRLSELNLLPPIARLLDLDQTEFRTDALCAFASWTSSRSDVALLSASGVWPAVLKACSPPPPPQQAVVSVGMNLLFEAAKTAAEDLDLDAAAFRALCDLCAASATSRAVDSVLCEVVLRCSAAQLPHYAAADAALQRLQHLAALEGELSGRAADAVARLRSA